MYNAGVGFSVVLGGPESFIAALKELDVIDDSCASEVPLTIIPAHGVPQTIEASVTEINGLGLDIGCS